MIFIRLAVYGREIYLLTFIPVNALSKRGIVKENRAI